MRLRKPNVNPIPEDLEKNYRLFAGVWMLNANKTKDYRKSVEALCLGLDKFIDSHGLYTNSCFYGKSVEEFEIRRNYLSKTGFNFMWQYLDSYLQHLDNTERDSHIEYLEKCWEHFINAT